jgi:hypothetical protein
MTVDVITSLKRSLENPITRHILKYLSKGETLEKTLRVFVGIGNETEMKCRFS